ncbi:MAG: hypothetical protein DUD32_10545 [Lactobacillus sp.]|nr:MAG: hypothetical protein DUD32_10545 [Lactobacillus sp.]
MLARLRASNRENGSKMGGPNIDHKRQFAKRAVKLGWNRVKKKLASLVRHVCVLGTFLFG